MWSRQLLNFYGDFTTERTYYQVSPLFRVHFISYCMIHCTFAVQWIIHTGIRSFLSPPAPINWSHNILIESAFSKCHKSYINRVNFATPSRICESITRIEAFLRILWKRCAEYKNMGRRVFFLSFFFFLSSVSACWYRCAIFPIEKLTCSSEANVNGCPPK